MKKVKKGIEIGDDGEKVKKMKATGENKTKNSKKSTVDGEVDASEEAREIDDAKEQDEL